MKASSLFLIMMMLCAACATVGGNPAPGRYGGPPLRDIENFDRADLAPPGAQIRPAKRQPTFQA